MFSVISFLAMFNKRSGHLNKIKECNTEGDTNKVIVHNEIALKTEQSCRNENEVDVNITNLFDQCSQKSKNTSLKFDYHDSNDSFARKCKVSLEKENRDNSKKKEKAFEEISFRMRHTELRDEISSLYCVLDLKNQQIRSLQNRLEEEKETKELLNRVQKELSVCKGEVENLKEQLTNKSADIRELSSRNALLQKSLNRERKNCELLRQTLDEKMWRKNFAWVQEEL
ncbi:uncharacterized protein LOC111696327 [Eurytemora carolleeae]|uniref:uncharacterized protein LOC111696327 n=1 Tax=Eurytemora carolleeae TaxID=1294199 RepID=UPI000C7789B4|nr:uncharacterized protein LOC111696327 [Eurytemora carolleeae]|eukprot:XP_023321670.1 uncharacterized protein LOC111696327 [Eurytemora affinis]